MNSVIALAKLLKGEVPLTDEEATALLAAIPHEAYSETVGGYSTLAPNSILSDLKKAFPQRTWRAIISHAGTRTRAVLTWKDPDPREYEEMVKRGSWDDDGCFIPHEKTR